MKDLSLEAKVLQISETNLETMSRTANGVLDMSASRTKKDTVQITDGDTAAMLARRNFEKALRLAVSERNRVFSEVKELRLFLEKLASEVNRDILKTGILYRCGEDSETKTYTLLSSFSEDTGWFYRELLARIRKVPYNPVETAAFTEYFMNMRIHMWADGCGKTSMVSSAYMMIRGGCLPVSYRSRSEYYNYDAPHRLVCNSPEDQAYYQRFLDYYHTLCNVGRSF